MIYRITLTLVSVLPRRDERYHVLALRFPHLGLGYVLLERIYALGLHASIDLACDWRWALVALRVALPHAPVMWRQGGLRGRGLRLDLIDIGDHSRAELLLERFLRRPFSLLLHALLLL